MRGQPTPVQRAEKLASQQHAAINRRQALQCGVTPRQIRRHLASGRWRAHTRDVFVIAGAPATWPQRAACAWLAGPPAGLLSHGTAAALHGLGRPPRTPHLTVPHGASGRLRGVAVHWARNPAGGQDRRWVGGLPCTDVARTVVDCAAHLAYDELCDLVDTAICERKTTPARIAAAADRAARSGGRKGLRPLREALAIWRPGPVADKASEMRLGRRLEEVGLPPLERQVKIRDAQGRVVAKGDLGISAFKFLFEYDGKVGHGPRHWAKDDERDRAVEAAGGKVFHYNRHDLLPSSTRLRDEILALLPLLRAEQAG